MAVCKVSCRSPRHLGAPSAVQQQATWTLQTASVSAAAALRGTWIAVSKVPMSNASPHPQTQPSSMRTCANLPLPSFQGDPVAVLYRTWRTPLRTAARQTVLIHCPWQRS
ncbi:hypothetical protein DUNSADRAFT_13830 [Dunaliella salina]|uniref:Encoded protein n=1 Tax=Dunaliella salina TaxID=3046 RepID=A0ABQ7G8I6_DUNSA|nr:hypothetical protein DUNSADRAFT_13830 [Dunaliella salina]|eukprot:KAF5830922.1 hypothetical protein DUNSADRAFT_13830 [Dunaliella salina]